MATASWIQVFVGIAVIVVVLRDLFHQLLHPHGTGTVARFVTRLVWRVAGNRTAFRPLAGPLAVGAVLATWFGLLVLGWTLALEPIIQSQFAYGTRIPTRAALADALYVSIVGTATLGYGDIVPSTIAARLLAPLQAVMGFVLLTAGLTWILSIYSPLVRRRALARNISVALATNTLSGTPAIELSRDFEAVSNDLSMFPSTLFFHDADPTSSLPHQALRLLEALTGEGSEPGTRMLRMSVDRFADAVERSEFPMDTDGSDTRQILERYATAHGH